MKNKTLLRKQEKIMNKIDFGGKGKGGLTPVDHLGIFAILLSVLSLGLFIFLR